jgi:hypothetical protein
MKKLPGLVYASTEKKWESEDSALSLSGISYPPAAA